MLSLENLGRVGFTDDHINRLRNIDYRLIPSLSHICESIIGEGRNKILASKFVELAEKGENAGENLVHIITIEKEKLNRLSDVDGVDIEGFYELVTKSISKSLAILTYIERVIRIVGKGDHDVKFSELCEVAENTTSTGNLLVLLSAEDSIKNLKNSGLTMDCIVELINIHHPSDMIKIADRKDGIIELLDMGFVSNDIVKLSKKNINYFVSVLDNPRSLLEDKAFTQGAAMGAFEDVLPEEIAGLVANHLSKKDGENLSQVNKWAKTMAGEERERAENILDGKPREVDEVIRRKGHGSLRTDRSPKEEILSKNSQGRSGRQGSNYQEKISAERISAEGQQGRANSRS